MLRDLAWPELEAVLVQQRHEEGHKLDQCEFAAQAGARTFRKRQERALDVRGYVVSIRDQLRIVVNA